MRFYKTLESTTTPTNNTYSCLAIVEEAITSFKDVLTKHMPLLKQPNVDTLVLTRRKEGGSFEVTKDKETLIFISQLLKYRATLDLIAVHEYGHAIHYNLETTYGGRILDTLIAKVNNELQTTKMYEQIANTNEEHKWSFLYDNKPDEVFARMMESLYIHVVRQQDTAYNHRYYTYDECIYFYTSLQLHLGLRV